MKNVFLRTMFGLAFAFIVLVPAGASLAQTQLDCAGDDVMAIYFENGDINFDAPGPFIIFDVYFALVNQTAPCFEGIEFRLISPSSTGYILLGTVIENNGLNFGTNPEYIIGFNTPIPSVDGIAHFMTQTVMLFDIQPRQYFLEPITAPSIPGNLAYACTPDLIPAFPISGEFALPIAQLNGPALDYCQPMAPLDMIVDISFDGDMDNIAGTSFDATDGFDVDYDLLDANTSLTFPHPEWNQPGGDNFRHDIKASYDPTLEVKQWTFVATAQGDQSGGEYVSLDFQRNFPVSPDLDFELYDRTTGITHDLFAQPTFQFFLDDGVIFNRTFDLFVGRSSTPGSSLWVDVTAASGGSTEAANRLSTNSLATDGYDPGLDIPEPIHPPSNYASSSFIHADWPLGPYFRTDARSIFDPTAEAKIWRLAVETDQSGTVVLDFAASFTAQDNIDLQLRDLQTGQIFHLFPQLNYAYQATGTAPREFDIIVGASGTPDLSPTSRVLDSGWALVGFPLRTAGANLSDAILDQVPGYAFMFDYQAAQGYSLLEPTDLALQNKGYWIGTDTGFEWTMTGDFNLDPVDTPLTEGWNLIANPMWFPGPFEGMVIIRNSVVVPWQTAVAAGYVATGVQSYDQNTGGYFNAVDLQPWHSYWIAALEPNLTLRFDWQNFMNLPARLTANNKSTLPLDGYAWSVDLTLADVHRDQTTISMGINAEATVGFDPRFDMPLAPAPPSGGPVLAFSRPEWNLASGSYFKQDVMPPSDTGMTWNAVVSVPEPGMAMLTWDSSQWPKSADFQIYLPSENRVVVMSMRAQSYLRLELGTEQLPIVIRTPNMVSGVEDTPHLQYRVGVHPNPFNPMTTISFDLPKGGDVEIRLFSVRGELVNVLGGEHYPVGSHQVVWQGNDRSGRNVPSGSYFAKLYVDGRAMGPVTKMSLVR